EQQVHCRFLNYRGNASAHLQRLLDHIKTQYRRPAIGGTAERSEDLQGRGFPGAVRSQQPKDGTGCNREAEAVYCANGAEFFDKITQFEIVGHDKRPISDFLIVSVRTCARWRLRRRVSGKVPGIRG